MLIKRMVLLAVPITASLGYWGAGPALGLAGAGADSGFSQWIVQAAPESRRKLDPHGLRLPVEVSLVPKMVRSGAGGDALDLDLDLLNTTDRPLKTVVSYEVFDDAGNAIETKAIGPKADLPSNHQATNATPGLQRRLADGYYQVKATVAWKGADTDGTASDYFFFRVRNGRITSVSADEWNVSSRVNEGVVR